MLLLRRFLVPSTLVTLFLVALTTSSLLACGSSFDLTPEEHIARAKDNQDKGEFQAAVIELKNALQQAPDNVEARWLLGQIYVETGVGPAAEKELRRAVGLGLEPKSAAIPLTRALLLQAKYQGVIDSPVNPDSLLGPDRAELWALWGDAHFGLGELDKADELYDTALSFMANNPEAGTGKARVAAARNHLEEAREQLARVLQTNPEFAQAWSLLGDIERYENNAKEAESAYSEAIARRVNNVVDLLNRALVRINLKDYERAAGDLEKAKKLAPNYPGVAYTQGLLHLAQGRYAEAQTAFQKAVNKNSNYMPALYYLGISHYMQGHTEQAEQHLRRFLNNHPTSDLAAKSLAALYISEEEYATAESLLKSVLSRNPDDIAALNLMAETAVGHGEVQEGIQYLRHVAAQQPESTDAYMRLGIGLMMEKEDQEALQAFEKATELVPSGQGPELLTIATYLQAGEYDKAIEAAKRLSEKQPDNPEPLTLMGGAYMGKGDKARARAAFKQALKVAPGSPSAANNLARLELMDGNTQEARRLYEEVLQHRPAHLASSLALIRLDVGEGKIEEAMELLEHTVQKHPGALQPRIALAGFYLRTDQPSRVLPLMRDLPEEQANNPLVLGVVGEAQLALGQSESAVYSFKRLVQAQPDSARAHFLLSQGYAASNQFTLSLNELDKVLAIKPDHLPSKITRIRILRLQKKTEEAAKLLSEIDPAHAERPDLLTETGWLALMQGHPKKAAQAFESVLIQEPSSDIVVALGTAKWQAGNQEGAIETYTGWLEKQPNDTQVRFHLANSRLMLGQTGEAKVNFEKMLEQSPDNAIALNNLAWLLRKSEPDRALSYAERAVEFAPDWPPATDTLGMLLLDQGESERALRLFQKASQWAPDSLDMRYHVALALVRLDDKDKAREILEAILAKQSVMFGERQEAELLLHSLDE